jgi:hypothetical protein
MVADIQMGRELSLFTGTFTTLLAIINPLEVLPVYLQLLAGKDDATHRTVAWPTAARIGQIDTRADVARRRKPARLSQGVAVSALSSFRAVPKLPSW